MSFRGNEINSSQDYLEIAALLITVNLEIVACQRRAETIYPTKLRNEKWMIISLNGSLLQLLYYC
jgi:hypothetical protein